MIIASLLVVLVLFVFLYEWRTALISVVAIPLSLITAALVLSARGATINTMILAGFVISLGAIVDDAIIDIENIVRRLRLHRTEGGTRSTARVILDASIEVPLIDDVHLTIRGENLFDKEVEARRTPTLAFAAPPAWGDEVDARPRADPSAAPVDLDDLRDAHLTLLLARSCGQGADCSALRSHVASRATSRGGPATTPKRAPRSSAGAYRSSAVRRPWSRDRSRETFAARRSSRIAGSEQVAVRTGIVKRVERVESDDPLRGCGHETAEDVIEVLVVAP